MSDKFPIHRGVRQGDPLSPKLFTAVMEDVFKKKDVSEGVNIDGVRLTNLWFADDAALFGETTRHMEKHLNSLNSESLKVVLKMHQGKTKYMTNHADSEDILMDRQKIEKVTEFKYLGQTTHLKDTAVDGQSLDVDEVEDMCVCVCVYVCVRASRRVCLCSRNKC